MNTTPRVEWALIGDGLQIRANKMLLVWSKKTQLPTLAAVSDRPHDNPDGDPRGGLMTEDFGKRLNWDDYCHYSYVAAPVASSADKELAVYARTHGEPWRKLWAGPPHETVTADAISLSLRKAGHEVTTTRTGHPPRN